MARRDEAPDDLFGLNKERRIQRSKVRQFFTPNQPISQIDLLFGREAEVESIIQALNTPGLHVILFGERGIGKSSLANVAGVVLQDKLYQGTRVVLRCDKAMSFDSLAVVLLKKLGVATHKRTEKSSLKQGGDAGLTIPVASAKIQTERLSETSVEHDSPSLNPAAIADLIQGYKALVIIDEFDAIPSEEDRKKVAELIKLLSDSSSTVKLLVVGIADSCDDLTAGHPSIERHVREIELRRMKNNDISLLLLRNSVRCELHFEQSVAAKIVDLSAGFPYFAQLLGLHCAEECVAEGVKAIGENHFRTGLSKAVEGAEDRLRRAYRKATQSTATFMYENIVHAAALIKTSEEFTPKQLALSMTTTMGKAIQSKDIRPHLRRLSNDGEEVIFRRVERGLYRFADPRMKSYVLMRIQRSLTHARS